MDFSVISDNLEYFLIGAYPNGPLGGAALTLVLSVLSGVSAAVLGTGAGHCPEQSQGLATGDIDRPAGFPAGDPRTDVDLLELLPAADRLPR